MLRARPTRIGVFEYTRPDGTTLRELRHPEEVFAADALASLKGAPVVVGHPDTITTENFQTHVVGHVGDDVAADGRFVACHVRVQEANAVESVLAKHLIELSCGYTCDVDPTPGTWDGEPYDVKQINIRYNHVGLGPKDWGRAGREVRLVMDAKQPRSMTPEEIEALRAQSRTDAAEAARLAGENTALRAENEKLRAAADEATSQKRIDALVTERLAVCDSARAVLGSDYVFAGKADIEIMKDAIAKTLPDVKCDGKSADFVRGVFESATRAPHPSLAETRADATNATASGDDVEAARKRNEERSRKAFGAKK